MARPKEMEDRQQVQVYLPLGQVEYLDGIALTLGVSRSAALRMVIEARMLLDDSQRPGDTPAT